MLRATEMKGKRKAGAVGGGAGEGRVDRGSDGGGIVGSM